MRQPLPFCLSSTGSPFTCTAKGSAQDGARKPNSKLDGCLRPIPITALPEPGNSECKFSTAGAPFIAVFKRELSNRFKRTVSCPPSCDVSQACCGTSAIPRGPLETQQLIPGPYGLLPSREVK